MKKAIWVLIILILVALVGWFILVSQEKEEKVKITNFEECVAAGNPVMESYPRQCSAGENTFTEEIGNSKYLGEKMDLIRIDFPRPNDKISSPLKVTGQARGYWFFEGDFPVVLVDWDGRIITQGIAQVQEGPEDENGVGWMTEDFVPFEAELEFLTPNTSVSDLGALILQKDNPSGLPENDDALEIPIRFE